MGLAGFLFKMGAAPMHPWAPDVYEAAPMPVIACLSVAPKLAGLGILTKFLLVLHAYGQSAFDWQIIIRHFDHYDRKLLSPLAKEPQENDGIFLDSPIRIYPGGRCCFPPAGYPFHVILCCGLPVDELRGFRLPGLF